MPDTIAALFKDEEQAESAVRALKSADFDSSEIEMRGPREPQLPDFGGNAARGVAFGSIGGTVLGAILGTFVAGVVPGSHAYVTGGWFVPFMLAMALGATGGLAGLLLSVGASRDRALYYEQEVQSGRYLVSVNTQPERREFAREILLSKGAMEAAPIDSPTVKRGSRRVVE
jgi:MFS family permease